MTQPETVEAMRAEAGQIIEPDAFAAYVRKVRAKSPHYDLNPSAAHARIGWQEWQRAKKANRRADAAEARALKAESQVAEAKVALVEAVSILKTGAPGWGVAKDVLNTAIASLNKEPSP